MADEAVDLDSIVAQTELSTNNEIAMEAAPEQIEAAAPTIQEYEFQHNGQAIKAPIEKVLRWASMGYGAPQKFGELSNKIKDYEGRLKGYEDYDKTYKPIDEWAKSNPDKWRALFDGWQQAQYGNVPQQGQPTAQIPPELIQKVQQLDQRFAEQDKRDFEQRNIQNDQRLDQEVVSIRKSFPNIDFDAPNQQGNSLEYQILEHATKNGIPSFRAAFRDYCFDQLNSMSESKGREKTALSPKTRAGLLGKDPAPAGRGQSIPDLKNKNYDQIHELILAEMGLGG